ncbi:MAG: sortase [Oscillospiraceae bacterium]|nr:sortase [Oscillospiraceae bacterium]
MNQLNNRETDWTETDLPDGSGARTGQTDSSAERAGARLDPGVGRKQRSYESRRLLKGAAGHAEPDAKRGTEDRHADRQQGRIRTDRDGVAAVLDEVEAEQRRIHRRQPPAADSSEGSDEAARTERPARRRGNPETSAERRKMHRTETDTGSAADAETGARHKSKTSKKKKKRKRYTLTDVLKIFIPWRGDSVFEGLRKIIFSAAVAVVGVCTFLISSYYIDLYQAKKEYGDMQARIEETLNNRGFTVPTYVEDKVTGEIVEYLDYNEIYNQFYSQNPDLIGYIRIKGTMVSYPVVQKKSNDINDNKNDYYLYRTFHQESSKSGCIFMDYRCHFDEVHDHYRIVDNSDNLLIYGHNMNNQTMFGSLRHYYKNPSYYMEHPTVELYSLYNLYDYKIFAIFVTDGMDFDSEYAFDCWNTLDFANEDEFYAYVNEAKKRTTVNTNVDVKYGDPILTLYTCHGLHANAKLILMCRQVRPGESLTEGTENATLNDNVLYTQQYYKYGHPNTFDINKFVPYGPES